MKLSVAKKATVKDTKNKVTLAASLIKACVDLMRMAKPFQKS